MPLPSGKPRILVVDADRDFADSLAQSLRDTACETRIAYNCEIAAAAAEEFNPDLLICEVAMPTMSGIELAYHFTQHHPDCRLVLVSDVESVIEVLEDVSLNDGFLFLRKPIHCVQVLEYLATSEARQQRGPYLVDKGHLVDKGRGFFKFDSQTTHPRSAVGGLVPEPERSRIRLVQERRKVK